MPRQSQHQQKIVLQRRHRNRLELPHRGGYQPAQKWLKDRKGRTLTHNGIIHYQKIIIALFETEHSRQEIDNVLNQPTHSGPLASPTRPIGHGNTSYMR